MTVDLDTAVRDAGRELANVGVPDPVRDASALAAHVLRVPDLAGFDGDLPAGFAVEFAAVISRRIRREPLARIVGHTVFRRLTLHVEPGVFIPRRESEVTAGLAVDEARRVADTGAPAVVVDLCAGSGAIGLSVGVEVPGTIVSTVELDPDAVRLARINNRRCGAPRMRILTGDVTDPGLLTEMNGTVDVLVSNPPFLPEGAIAREPEIAWYEKDLALYGGHDGLAVISAVVAAGERLLRPGGLLLIQHADVLGRAVAAVIARTGAFTPSRTVPDQDGLDRVASTRRRKH